MPKKLGFQIVVDGFEVKKRVATNTFLCESVITGDLAIYPGDHLVKVKGYDRSTLAQLCARMEETLARNAAVASPRVTRSRAAANPSLLEDVEPSMSSIQAMRDARLFHLARGSETESVLESANGNLEDLF